MRPDVRFENAGMDLNAEYHSNKERKRSSLSDMSDETIEDLYNILLNERKDEMENKLKDFFNSLNMDEFLSCIVYEDKMD